jgi:methyl-accepting chemotaxis protein I, serine sensor receptor
MKTLSIRARLILAMAAMAILLALSAAMAIFGLSHANAGMEEMYGNRMASAQALADSMANLLRVRTALDRVVLEPDSPQSAANLTRALGFAAKSDAAWQRYLALPAEADERKLSDAVQAQRQAYLAQGQGAMVEALRAGRVDEARSVMLQRMAPMFTALSARVDALNDYQTARAAGLYKDNREAYQGFLWWTGGGLALGLAVVLLSATQLTRAIVRPLDTALGHMRAIGAGDLTGAIAPASADEMGRMMAGLGGMQASLVETVAGVLEGSRAIAIATREIAQGNVSLSARTETQASALEETASSMEELTATVQQNAEHALRAAQLAGATDALAGNGSEQVRKVAEVMNQVLATSRRIEEITGLIESIAFQTNILALNAAVEAARAGDQGRGFAVVASEVRNLAQRCAGAARDIGGVIGESVQLTRSGAVLAQEAGDGMNAILGNIGQVSRLVADISAASQEQAAGIEQVNEAIVQMEQVTQHNAALVEQSLAASESLREQAAALESMVGRFTLHPMPHERRRRTPVVQASPRHPAIAAEPKKTRAAAPAFALDATD